jgi:hypothetical protein
MDRLACLQPDRRVDSGRDLMPSELANSPARENPDALSQCNGYIQCIVGLLGSESKFIVPLARPPGAMLCIAMKLASDPNNP